MEREPITTEGIAALEAEIADLEGRARTELAGRIKAARELGDLKENAEYHIAKEEQAHLETRIQRLRQRLRSAEVVETRAEGEVAFGTTVTVTDEATGRQSTYRIVGATEADVAGGRLSVESPVAQALLGVRLGEVAVVSSPRGERRLRVQRVEA